MRPRQLFWASLAAFILLYGGYGLKRLTLGIDFTDEGAYLSWPMRMLFGEKLFSSDLGTLLRPLVAHLFILFKLHPGLTVYEFRLLGWGLHLLSFSILSLYVFRLSNAPVLSPLLASVPLFVCNIFGLASPSYNSLSSDFLLMALSLRGLAAIDGASGKLPLNIGSGLALFLATLAHPALGLVAAVMLLRELLARDLAQNLIRRRLTGSNAGVLVFAGCWLVFVLYLAGSGALADWIQRTAMFRSFTVTALNTHPVRIFLQLLTYPFSYSLLARVFTLAALITLGALRLFSHRGAEPATERAALLLVFLLGASLVCGFSYEADFLPTGFALACLVLIGTHSLGLAGKILPVDPETRFLLLMSGLGAVVYASFTFYFSPLRSWTSGILALPFAFATGSALLLRARPAGSGGLRILVTASLMLAVAGTAWEHYQNIYRDAGPAKLPALFHLAKFAHIRSTEERVRAVEALYDNLHPRLARGEPLLAFDDCPMLYYLFDAMPAYGLTWATRYTQSPAALQQLDRELRARPLPRYAIRTLVDLSNPVWSTAPRTSYDNYPLNDTVLAHYELEQTIFPFEIWRLKTAGR